MTIFTIFLKKWFHSQVSSVLLCDFSLFRCTGLKRLLWKCNRNQLWTKTFECSFKMSPKSDRNQINGCWEKWILDIKAAWVLQRCSNKCCIYSWVKFKKYIIQDLQKKKNDDLVRFKECPSVCLMRSSAHLCCCPSGCRCTHCGISAELRQQHHGQTAWRHPEVCCPTWYTTQTWTRIGSLSQDHESVSDLTPTCL